MRALANASQLAATRVRLPHTFSVGQFSRTARRPLVLDGGWDRSRGIAASACERAGGLQCNLECLNPAAAIAGLPSANVHFPLSPPARAALPPASSVDTGAAVVVHDTNVAVAIRTACKKLRKPYPEEAVAALLDNWYSTAGELAALPDDTARSLGVPLRLKSAVAEMLDAGEGPDGSAAAAAAPWAGGQQAVTAPQGLLASARQLPAQAERLINDLFGGDGSSTSSNAEGVAGGQQMAVAEAPAAASSSSSSSPMQQGEEAASSSLAAAVASLPASWDWEQAHLLIEQRTCPPISRFGHSYADTPKVTKRQRSERYALSEAEVQLSASLAAELDAFHRFCTVRFFGAQAEPISEVTAAKYADHLRGILGWLHRERGVPLKELSFSAALPSSGREGVSVLFDYILW